MSNLEKYNSVFIEVFEVTEDILSEYKYQDTASWDSVGHMTMIASLEETFDIMMDTEDIIDFSSYAKGKEILKKYDVEL
ncbi:acyl carrier protein [Pectobacterium aroidearum]|uniref:Acyl carrier protein n=1 Tax=Pectobacterium aroidearum TaxID=1201031 RepID=A0AAW3SQE0_9GAMM|nr:MULTISPECIES: acyl carrier protein [Pectobacterium]MBA5198797.1 acyl carrier protein [Pectobacterium aroidearum]MBA5203156.1 acyl carrier protein [Pectobacterium aroidearum]MBA5226700.1 acyl carrier protein [Pectobacterium aroidearum]MBA5231589.1 acyl carrier protein [Pectobacterium aroidearum]MBA5736734.1 acyl carrier protein [Pectobacterium aroidearum]